MSEQDEMLQFLQGYFADYIPAAICVTCVRTSNCTARACQCECHGGHGMPGELPDSFFDELRALYGSKVIDEPPLAEIDLLTRRPSPPSQPTGEVAHHDRNENDQQQA